MHIPSANDLYKRYFDENIHIYFLIKEFFYQICGNFRKR